VTRIEVVTTAYRCQLYVVAQLLQSGVVVNSERFRRRKVDKILEQPLTDLKEDSANQ
jgi:hypothetical protein